jgi:hypothetical protein
MASAHLANSKCYYVLFFEESPSSDLSSNEESPGGCDHVFDGGVCLDCGVNMPCVLCDEHEWVSRCDICEGGMICDECYEVCEKCDQKFCKVCGECDCDD